MSVFVMPFIILDNHEAQLSRDIQRWWDEEQTMTKQILHMKLLTHEYYENMPIQIYRIFHLQKLKIYR